jgi:hypothetical protein
MTGVRTHALIRSIRAMTVGTVADHQAMRDRIAELGLQELDQQYQLTITGRIDAGQALDMETTVTFDAPFIDGYDQRHSYLTDPLFTYGSIVTSGPPMLVSCHVRKWLIDDEQWTGAQLQIVLLYPGVIPTGGGAIATEVIDSRVPFAGEIHLNFQGYGPPEPDDYGDD